MFYYFKDAARNYFPVPETGTENETGTKLLKTIPNLPNLSRNSKKIIKI
jgi:hypothetical protein